MQQTELAGKRLELLREIVLGLRQLAIMANVDLPNVAQEVGGIQATGGTLGLDVAAFEIRRAEDIAPAFETLRSRAQALYVVGDALVITHRVRINTWALAARLPTMHGTREVVEAGGLISMDQLPRPVQARGRLCGQDSAGGEAWGHSCRAADQIRLGRQ